MRFLSLSSVRIDLLHGPAPDRRRALVLTGKAQKRTESGASVITVPAGALRRLSSLGLGIAGVLLGIAAGGSSLTASSRADVAVLLPTRSGAPPMGLLVLQIHCASPGLPALMHGPGFEHATDVIAGAAITLIWLLLQVRGI